MKFSRKLLSIVSAMSMAACVFASPVFAEDSSTATSAPVVDEDIDTELAPVDLESPDTDPGAQTADPIITEKYIKLENGEFFNYDKENKHKVTSSFEVNTSEASLPSDLIYTISWESNSINVAKDSLEVSNSKEVLKPGQNYSSTSNDQSITINFSKDSLTNGTTIYVKFSLKIQTSDKDASIKLTETAKFDQSKDPLSESTTIYPNQDDSSVDSEEDLKPGNQRVNVQYSSTYDEKDNTLTLDINLPSEMIKANEPLYIQTIAANAGLSSLISEISAGKVALKDLIDINGLSGEIFEGIDSITISNNDSDKRTYDAKTVSTWINKEISNKYLYTITIQPANIKNKISVAFKVKPNIDKAYLWATAFTRTYNSKESLSEEFGAKAETPSDEGPYSISSKYYPDKNTWNLGISDVVNDSIDAFPNTTGSTVITVTSNPDVLTGITDFKIGKVGYTIASNDAGITVSKNGTESAPADVQAPSEEENEDTENEAGEVSILGIKKVSNGYEITIPNADLQTLKTETIGWIDMVFSTKPDMTKSKMYVVVTNTDDPDSVGNYSEDIEKPNNTPSNSNSQTNTPGGTNAETNPVSSSASFKASHNYDSATQTWTVTLNMTARPAKLDLSFNQKQGTALLKPTSFTINNAAVSPAVNATMSGSTMSVCSVSFSQADLAKVTNGTVVKLVFPVDGSKEQSEKITMTVNTGNASKDLNASFTVKKTTNGGVPTATETGAQPLVIVLVVAVIALAVFGYLAFRKKKKN